MRVIQAGQYGDDGRWRSPEGYAVAAAVDDGSLDV